jgi:hypothetical protein
VRKIMREEEQRKKSCNVKRLVCSCNARGASREIQHERNDAKVVA